MFRIRVWFFLPILWGVSSTTLWASTPKYTAVVQLDKVEMRAGHSWQFPATGALKKGEQIIVHHEEDNWAAILPPPGSTSWIQSRFLGRIDPNQPRQNVEVITDPQVKVDVRVGGPKGVPSNIYQVKLARGTIVEVVGGPVKAEDSTWYPITPPEGEYRWVPKEAIGSPSPVAPPPSFVQRGPVDGQTTSSRTSPKDGPSGITASPAVANTTWEKAEQAERSGNYVLAEQLYTQIYNEIRRTKGDPDLELRCYNRILLCQERQRLDGGLGRGNPNSEGSRPASLVQPLNPSVGGNNPAWPNNNSAKSVGTGNQRWTGVGKLRRSGFMIDGRQAFALDDSNNRPFYYVLAAPNVNLDRYVNQHVNLYGTVQTRGDVRGGEYMVVSEVKAGK